MVLNKKRKPLASAFSKYVVAEAATI